MWNSRSAFLLGGFWLLLQAGSAVAAVPFDVTLIDGQTVQGELSGWNEETVRLRSSDGKETSHPLTDVLEIVPVPGEARVPDESETPSLVFATLGDGSFLSATEISVDVDRAVLQSPSLGAVELSPQTIRYVRFGNANSTVMEKWEGLKKRELKKDLLVIHKGETVDFIEGIVGKIGDKSVQFLLGGEEIPVDRKKVFGVCYHRDPVETSPLAILSLKNGDRLVLKSFTIEGDSARGETASGVAAVVPVADLAAVDFRPGRLAYLSDLEPRDEEYTPFFDVVWRIRRDRNYDGGPLRLGGKTWAKGLCIHSKTELGYRLVGQYRRLQAWVGIDELVGRKGNVHLTIEADGKILFEGDVKGTDPPRRIDADIAGVNNLEILVDFGGDLDISDHLDLADARLIK